ncbi:hypothetical protein ACFFJY_05380 [Fictibacillus aquaticus]|uniref:hypothetical protein n=1 Tax=Fictibacillus aquaticus TaxID=2021314 RepID=UPI0035ECF4F2
MNRQFTEEEMHAADLIEELKSILSALHITDEDFLESCAQAMPDLKNKLRELERYSHP